MSTGFLFAASPVMMDFSKLDDGSNNDTQQGWVVNGVMDNIAGAKYLVIETNGVGNNTDGFGGIQLIFQGNSNDNDSIVVGWTERALNGNWVSYAREDGKTISIAIDLKNVMGDQYAGFLQCNGWARILLGYYSDGGLTAFEGLALKNAYLTGDFAKPSGALDLSGGTDWGFIFDGSVTDITVPEAPEMPVVISDFSKLDDGSNNDTQQGWVVNGVMDSIAVAKYLVIETNGVGNNADGFGGIQLIFQGNNDDNSIVVGWTQRALNGDWISYNRENGKTISIAIDLKNVMGDQYADFLQCKGWARILLGYYPDGMTAFQGLGLTNVYLTGDFVKPEGAVDLSGGTDWGFIFDGSIAGSQKTVLSPSNNVPGVYIATVGTDQYTGANIILGSDASVWPWSSAGYDGLVAFTPVKGATYHMTFNVTSSGAEGFRVRWMKDNAYDNHTASDATEVNNHMFTADQTADFVPAYFQNTIANGETKTYAVDFTMDGNQPSDGLVGNIAIRAEYGSTDFVINTIVITDAAGNMLVNYDKDAAAIIPTLSVSATSLNFAAAGGQQTFTISSNTDWTVNSSDSLITVSPVVGSNNGTVTVTAAENTATTQRTATITVSGTGVTPQSIQVMQETSNIAPSNNVPGVHVYDMVNGVDSWSGANIILGSDASVWPWSTAGYDGLVAFTPVKDATYHMTFNVTSSGADGFRVRWIKDDSNGAYTAGDVAVVDNHVFTADQTADFVPAYFQNTISSGETKTYAVDFTMDGSQFADGLVGNLAIRGQFGSNDFVVNTIQITDSKGNMLVNYEREHQVEISDFEVVDGVLVAYHGAGGDVVIPDDLGITAIGYNVFNNNASITSVVIPEGVTEIGSMAFGWCSNLSSLTLPNTLTAIGDWAFAGCIASVTLPNTLETIGDYAFYDCGLTSITIPASVVSIGDMAFAYDWNLSTVNVDSNNSNYSSIDGVLYSKDQTTLYLCPIQKSVNTFIIPNSVTTIASYAFYDCWGINKIVIPASVSSIGDYAFDYCNPYQGFTVYWTTTPPAVSDNVFSNPSNTSLFVPAGTTSIYQEAPVWQDFIIIEQAPAEGLWLDKNSAYMLPGNTMQLNATIWPNNASNLNVIWSSSDESVATVSNTGIITGVNLGIATITATPEEGGYSSDCTVTVVNTDFVVIDNVLVAYLGSATDVVIPDNLGITEIGANVFANNTSSIKSVVIPNGVTTIDDSAFAWYYSLAMVTLPNTLTTIGDNAFADCGFSSITIPDSVISIGNYAFSYSGLTSVLIPNSVESIGDWAFGGCWNLSAINVDESNPNYSSMDGLLYNKSKTVLDTYPAGKQVDSLSILNSVTDILPSAFQACSYLTSVTIPNSVMSIGLQAFAYCGYLTDVTVNWTEPLTLSPDDYIFYGANTADCTLHVPYGTKALYEAADVWKDFGTIVEEVPYTLSVSSDSLNFIASGEQQTFVITSNTDWTVSCNASWLTISPDSASNDGTVTVTAAENTTTSQRTAIITIIGTGVDLNGDGIVDSNDAIQISVTQDAGVETSVKNISNASFYAYFISNMLKVQSANAEIITVYSATGVQLYSAKKDAGMIEIPFSSIPGSYIIKGSVSGTIKVVK